MILVTEPNQEVWLRPLQGVRELRQRRMLSQQELADLAGVSLFTIQRIERGEGSVRPKTGRAIAEALGVGVEELLPKVTAPSSSLEPSFNDVLRDEERRILFNAVAYAIEKHTAIIAYLLNTLPNQPDPEEWERGTKRLEQMLTVIGADLEALEDSGAGRVLVETLAARERSVLLDEATRQAAENLRDVLAYLVSKISPMVSSWVTRSGEAHELVRGLETMLAEQQAKAKRMLELRAA